MFYVLSYGSSMGHIYRERICINLKKKYLAHCKITYISSYN